MIYCNYSACDNLENNPCSSKRIYEIEKAKRAIHPFCHACIIGQATAAVGESIGSCFPLAKGGIGLHCMMGGCDNPVLYSEIYKLLPKNIQNKLEERIFEESVGIELLDNLERDWDEHFGISCEEMDERDKRGQFINQVFECLVCYDEVELNRVVFCNIHVSATEDPDTKAHAFCSNCVCEHASAATEEIPMAKGGIGLRCMATGCDNPILYSEIRMFISEDVQKKLDERILQESIGMASIDKLERSCKTKFCRTCERDWDEKHVGLSCEEMDKNDKDRKEREIEKKLNEAIVRKCPRCGIGFVKLSGCNKMTCRCGMTQCYICRQSGIQYAHFCQHTRDPNNPICKHCNSKCLLFEDANKRDEQLIKEIREREEANA
uniref:RING-type domain-containing protein n=1 Tax=Meloidogyne javanica TaxID=6303 RepID=A0A915LQH3_MELJA